MIASGNILLIGSILLFVSIAVCSSSSSRCNSKGRYASRNSSPRMISVGYTSPMYPLILGVR